MQGCTVLALVVALFAGQAFTASLKNEPGVYIFEDVINNTLNSVVQNLSDPFIIEQLDLAFPEGGLVAGTLSVSNAELSGLRNIVASSISLSILSLTLEMTIQVSSITVNTDYVADLTINDTIAAYGNGKMNVDIENVQIDISTKVDLSNGIRISNSKVTLHVGAATFDLHGLLNDEEFSAEVSAALTQYVAAYINDNADTISGIISPIIENIINSILNPEGAKFYSENVERLYHELKAIEHKRLH